MQLRTQHFLQLDAVIVVLIAAYLLLLGRLAAQTSGAFAVSVNQPLARAALGDRLLNDAPFPIGEVSNREVVGFSRDLGLANSGAELLGTGHFFSDAYGHDFGNGFKIEIERLTYDTAMPGASGIAAGGVRTTGSVLSGLYEFHNDGWLVKPYVGVGLGVADPSAGLLGSDDRFLLTAFQLRAVSIQHYAKTVRQARISLEPRQQAEFGNRRRSGGVSTQEGRLSGRPELSPAMRPKL
jgi:hypothetical protein